MKKTMQAPENKISLGGFILKTNCLYTNTEEFRQVSWTCYIHYLALTKNQIGQESVSFFRWIRQIETPDLLSFLKLSTQFEIGKKN